MHPSRISIADQLQTASQLATDCERHQAELRQLQQHLQELFRTRDEELAALQRTASADLAREQQEIGANADRELDTLKLDSQARLESLKDNHEKNIRNLNHRLSEEVQELNERLKSELWMLQSVMDEEVDDSPLSQFDREAETFATQASFMDERAELLQQQVQHTGQFLASCHAAVETAVPEPNLASRKLADLRDIAVESGDLALSEAAELEQWHLAQWIRGGRIWGFSLLAFLMLWLPVVAIRADLKLFVNPEILKPDWEWAGVSALIAGAVVVLGCFIVLMSVQGRLRESFQSMLQHVSNAASAQALWRQKKQKQLDHLESVAQEWRQQMEQQRRKQTGRITDEINSRIAALRHQAAEQTSELNQSFKRQTEKITQDLAASEYRIELQRTNVAVEAETRAQTAYQSDREACEQQFQRATAGDRAEVGRILASWSETVNQLRSLVQTSTALAANTLRWPQQADRGWRLPQAMPNCLSVGDILITALRQPDSSDATTTTKLCLEMPAILRFPVDTSIVVEHDSAGREAALSFLRTQLLRLLTVIPAGRIRLTLIDPVGLGQSFSAMMHLADFDELLIHSRIWTDSSQIRGQLQKVTEHMENIFQTYLRSQFETIEEYNASAGEVAEPYHFVVVAGFPAGFTDESARHLSSILTSGPRCGVHAMIAWNPATAVPTSFDTEDLTNSCVRFRTKGDQVQPVAEFSRAVLFEEFREPPADEYVRLVRAVGEQSKDARRVEVSFNRIAPRDNEVWSHSTADGIDLPIGRAGAARLQFMRLGRGTSQHVLIAGKTGSGKSTFLHILITNLALHYGPDEIQFYLIDFKKGVEFRTYAANHLPHARVVAIESDREFGLSVLERLDEILQERGELFRERGMQDVPSFRKHFPNESMPRLLLLIDEFQEFFTAEDRVSARASLLLDRLVRQGRAFGIHVLLGSQTLGGAYSLARSTMGQIAVRIALQCSESDAHLILSEDNSAARLLTRPGEAIYNDANGMVQGNHQFQVAWLDEDRREEAIRTMLQHSPKNTDAEYRMVVFEGNVPPTAELCAPLNAYLTRPDDATRRTTDAMTIWLGEPVAIAAPTAIELRRASGQNLLIVGQDEAQVDSLLAYTILSTCGRSVSADPAAAAPQLTVLHDGRDTDSLSRFAGLHQSLNVDSFTISAPDQCEELVQKLHSELVAREEDSARARAPERVLIVRNVGQFRSLRKDEDDFGLGGFGEAKPPTTSGMFSDILKRGPLVGIHLVVWSDTFNNAIRWLSSSMLREFENRIAFRMNQTDSASLVDSPVAASLGAGRALVYRDQTGTTEKFRPFAWPSTEWLQSLTAPQDAGQVETDFDIDSLTIE